MVAVVLAATVVFGFAVHAVAGAIDDSWTTTASPEADTMTRFLDAWVVIPAAPGDSRTVAYIGLVALVLLATTVKGIWRWAVLVPTLYLAAFVWENVMSLQPDVTRFVLLGAMLVAVMVTRPSGILGERRVEIV
jgi:ABC-type branched-subunit amino acid transport system permease subunit